MQAENVQYNTRSKATNVCFETFLFCSSDCYSPPLSGHLLRFSTHFRSTSKAWLDSCYSLFQFCLQFVVHFHPVYCVASVAGFSGLNILDFPFGFLYHLFALCGTCISHFSMRRSVFFSRYLFSLILLKNLQFDCIPHHISSYNKICM